MILNGYIKYVLVIYIFFSCSNTMKNVEVPEFQVSVTNNEDIETTSFKVGDTINFSFKGNPNNISFYSGEIGYRYEYEGSDIDSSSDVRFNFATAKNTNGSGTLSLFISNDYAGYEGNQAQDSTNINKATWTDISNRAIWSTNTTTTLSGTFFLSDYVIAGKPVTLAYRYSAEGNTPQASYTISKISLRHYARDTSYLIDTTEYLIPTSYPDWTYSPGWARISGKDTSVNFIIYNGSTAVPAAEYSGLTTTSFVINGNTSSSSLSTQSWLVSGPIDLQQVLPETSIPVKDRTENAETIRKGFYASQNANYTYTYSKPGKYNVVFKAYNSTSKIQSYYIQRFVLDISE